MRIMRVSARIMGACSATRARSHGAQNPSQTEANQTKKKKQLCSRN